MPRICYIPKSFNATATKIIDIANSIIREYAQQGLDLTLRQVYYQFVARGYIPNSDREYNRLGSVINDARLAGLIDWEAIVDRTRYLESISHYGHPKDMIDVGAKAYHNDLWETQPNYVEVWIEKDALKGVIAGICDSMDTPYFSCRGYTSQSEMWGTGQRLLKKGSEGKGLYILHLGDHDPSGIDMSRDIKERLTLFINPHKVTLRRIALNYGQVQQYRPPPNPAKVTDSRAKEYIAKYGNQSWELDALNPTVLITLIRHHILELRDERLWQAAVESQEKGRKVLKIIHKRWPEVMRLLAT